MSPSDVAERLGDLKQGYVTDQLEGYVVIDCRLCAHGLTIETRKLTPTMVGYLLKHAAAHR